MTETTRELTTDCVIGERVVWGQLDGKRFDGTLAEWDNGTAIVRLDDGREIAVRCS